MAKDNNIMVDILVLLLTISYCTGMCFVYYIILCIILYCYLLYTCSCSPYAICMYLRILVSKDERVVYQ